MSTTSFNVFYEKFFDKVQNDIDFFNYFGLPEDEAMDLAKERAEGFLKESFSLLMYKCTPDVNFNDFDDENKCLNFEATFNEINLIACLMFEFYLEKDISKMRPIINMLTSSDIKVLFSPANDRKTFMDMYKDYKNSNELLIRDYTAKDRFTGKLKTILYTN